MIPVNYILTTNGTWRSDDNSSCSWTFVFGCTYARLNSVAHNSVSYYGRLLTRPPLLLRAQYVPTNTLSAMVCRNTSTLSTSLSISSVSYQQNNNNLSTTTAILLNIPYQDQDELMLHNHYKLSHCPVLITFLQRAVLQFYREGNFLDVATLGLLLSWGQANRVCFLNYSKDVTWLHKTTCTNRLLIAPIFYSRQLMPLQLVLCPPARSQRRCRHCTLIFLLTKTRFFLPVEIGWAANRY